MTGTRIILDSFDIERIIARFALEIVEKHRGTKGLALIGIQTRGVYLAKRIQEKINAVEKDPVPTGELDINLYRDDWTRRSFHPVVKPTQMPFSVDGKHIVLVDDVLFTGRTIRAAMDAVMDYGRPDSIELAVIVDRGFRELPIAPNYVGRFAETHKGQTVNVLLTEHDNEDSVMVRRVE